MSEEVRGGWVAIWEVDAVSLEAPLAVSMGAEADRAATRAWWTTGAEIDRERPLLIFLGVKERGEVVLKASSKVNSSSGSLREAEEFDLALDE